MLLSETITKEWRNALYSDCDNRSGLAKIEFRRSHPQEYVLLNSFYKLRSNLFRDISVMSLVGPVYWITLTFDNKHDKNKIQSKRKSATTFLNSLFHCYEMIEEFGEDNNRYHIHAFGCSFRPGKSYNDFVRWPCRQKIEYLGEKSLRKKAKYLTKYAVKALPRRRRSKSLVLISNYYMSNKSLFKSFPTLALHDFKLFLCLNLGIPYNEYRQSETFTYKKTLYNFAKYRPL